LAYVPMLSKLNPGVLEHAHNVLDFARVTVTEWLEKYKFANWTVTQTTKRTVTAEDRVQRASEIAQALAAQSRWKTHGRSLRLPDLESLGLQIVNYATMPKLNDAITRYHVLARMALENGNAYKMFERPDAGITMRFRLPAEMQLHQVQGVQAQLRRAPLISVEIICGTCQNKMQIEMRMDPKATHTKGKVPYPKGGLLACPKCGTQLDLRAVRQQIEAASGRSIVEP
jgi:hypothetical protein